MAHWEFCGVHARMLRQTTPASQRAINVVMESNCKASYRQVKETLVRAMHSAQINRKVLHSNQCTYTGQRVRLLQVREHQGLCRASLLRSRLPCSDIRTPGVSRQEMLLKAAAQGDQHRSRDQLQMLSPRDGGCPSPPPNGGT